MDARLVSTWRAVWLMRLRLGVAEGDVIPATLVLLSNWFIREERARANAYWMLCQPFAVAMSSPFSGYILGRWAWRTVLVVEGCLPFLWLVVWTLRIDDRPQDARWMPDRERVKIIRLLQIQAGEKASARRGTIMRAVLSPETGLMTAVSFLLNWGGYGFLFWLPSALANAKRPPLSRSVSLGASICLGRSCDGHQWPALGALPRPAIPRHASPGSGGLSLLAAAVLIRERSFLTYSICICLAGAGTYGVLGPFWAMPAEILPVEAAASATGLINAIGNLGGFFGPLAVGVLARLTGRFGGGFVALSFSLVIAGPLAFRFKPGLVLHNVPPENLTTGHTDTKETELSDVLRALCGGIFVGASCYRIRERGSADLRPARREGPRSFRASGGKTADRKYGGLRYPPG